MGCIGMLRRFSGNPYEARPNVRRFRLYAVLGCAMAVSLMPGAAEADEETTCVDENCITYENINPESLDRFVEEVRITDEDVKVRNFELLDSMYEHRHNGPSYRLIILARAIHALGNYDERALVFYELGRIKMFYDAYRCTDTTAGQNIFLVQEYAMDVGQYLADHPERHAEIAAQALELEKAYPENSSAYWVCSSGLKGMGAAMNGKEYTDWHVPVEEWAEIRAIIREEYYKALVQPYE